MSVYSKALRVDLLNMSVWAVNEITLPFIYAYLCETTWLLDRYRIADCSVLDCKQLGPYCDKSQC